jgi:hypothetical protein
VIINKIFLISKMSEIFMRIEDMGLPIIYDKNQSTLDIVRDTKKMVVDTDKFHSIIKHQQRNARNIKHHITYKLPNLESFKHNRIKHSLNLSKDYLNTEPDIYLSTEPSVYTKSTLMSMFSKSQDSLYDHFSCIFAEYLGVGDMFEDGFINKKNRFEEHCIKTIGLLKNNINDSCVFVKHYNAGHEVQLKLKSFKFVLEGEGLRKKIYLPFDFITIFGLCTNEQIIFILSQCIDFNEIKASVKLDAAKVINMLLVLPYFNYDMAKAESRFKMNRNLQFEWITDNKQYKTTLICPKISFSIVHKTVKLTKYLSRDLFLEVYPNDYMQWDRFVLSYLTLDKEFRNIFIKVITNKMEVNGPKVISIDRRFRPLESPSLEMMSLPLVYQTNKDITYFITARGYRIEFNKQASGYNLTWRNTLTLLKLRDYINIDSFVSRRTYLDDEGKIHFDKNFIDNISNELIEFFNVYKCADKPKTNFNLIQPYITCQTFTHNRWSKQRLTLPFDFNDELVTHTDVNNIIEYFCKQLKVVISLIHTEESKHLS